jgi:hypothetical protein
VTSVGGVSTRLCVRVLTVAVLALPSAAAGGGGPGGPVAGYGPFKVEARALGYCGLFASKPARYRSCFVDHAVALILSAKDSADELPRIDAYVHSVGGSLQDSCHVMMHAVGRRYAKAAHVTLSTLLNYLPKTNDPGCSAGFAHGMLIYLGPQIVTLGPSGAAKDCNRAPTRYQRYSCIHGLGHAYARLFNDTIAPALEACRELGSGNAGDCAQGVYHDYWIAVSGLDATHKPAAPITSPRRLCATQPLQFARACWYRAFLERPPPGGVRSAGAIIALCRGLHGLEEQACVSGASLVRSDDPTIQMRTCARLRGVLGVACARGVRIPSVALSGLGLQVSLIRQCASFGRAAARGCYQWLGEGLNVITNGSFRTTGCPHLRYAATRAACNAGGLAYNGPLETFS